MSMATWLICKEFVPKKIWRFFGDSKCVWGFELSMGIQNLALYCLLLHNLRKITLTSPEAQ